MSPRVYCCIAAVAALGCRARYPAIREVALSRNESFVKLESGQTFRLHGRKGAERVTLESFPEAAPPSSLCAEKVPADVSDVVEARCGEDFGCALRKNGTVACWGDNTRYQLARAERGRGMKAELVFGILEATRLFVGPQSACVTLREGGAKCWGANDQGQLGDGRVEDHNVPVYIRILKPGT